MRKRKIREEIGKNQVFFMFFKVIDPVTWGLYAKLIFQFQVSGRGGGTPQTFNRPQNVLLEA